MVLFYTENIQANQAIFQSDELRHIQHALRKQTGGEIFFTDGKGSIYQGVIVSQNKKHAVVEWSTKTSKVTKHPQIHLAVAPTKNIDRIEWLLEKSTELGIVSFHCIKCKHSERKNVKFDRLQRIATSAMKQSLKATKPSIPALENFDKWIKKTIGNRYIATLHDKSISLAVALTKLKSQEKSLSDLEITIAIGPEGGFREDEVEAAIKEGFIPVHLGSERLRTETAGIFSVSTVHAIYQQDSES
jgi:16S rRNA (uracil1498-N3)-methyltransferase